MLGEVFHTVVRVTKFLWIWSHRQLWSARSRCWEPNPHPLGAGLILIPGAITPALHLIHLPVFFVLLFLLLLFYKTGCQYVA